MQLPYKIQLLFLTGLITLFIGCKQKSYLPPTEGETIVKMNMEDGDKSKKHTWFDLLHQAAPGIDWKAIEWQNSLDQIEIKKRLQSLSTGSRGQDEYVADGNLLGRWLERGSTNQAGSVLKTAYDPKTDEILLISAGGTLFSGDRTGLGWTIIQQDLRFSDNLLELIYNQNQNRRILASIGNIPFYSDDYGKSWIKSTGIPGNGSGEIRGSVRTKDDHIFILYKKDYWSNFSLYQSIDNGESFSLVQNLPTYQSHHFCLTKSIHNDDIYLMARKNDTSVQIFRYQENESKFVLITDDSPVQFGSDKRVNLRITNAGNKTTFFSYDASLKFFKSDDFGVTWEYLSTLPKEPWNVGVFISTSNPNHMVMGEVDAYRSRDGGKTWLRINAWWEYYGNVAGKLHADIMALQEFTTNEGKPFLLISNHGGLSISYDGGIINDNIGMFDLNISQYYDVRSFPSNPDYLFAGAQDQGFQKGFIPDENPEPFTQVISGDYGHIAFSENGKRLWTVYPGGYVTYYPNPLSAGSSAGFELNSDEESVWIPPLVESPDPAENAVYMAGGNINGGKGSHLVKLTYNKVTGDIDASQFNFNFKTSGGELSAIAFSPFNKQKIYCATTNGKFYISQNNGAGFTYQTLGLPGAQYLYGSCILPSSLDSNTVYISGSGYSVSGVVVSKDGGKTFAPLNNGLPKTTVFNLAMNPEETLIFAATEAGPYVYIQQLKKWFLLSGASTPNQTFWSVEFLPSVQTARFGTYGRGVWDFQLREIKTTAVNTDGWIKTNIYPNPVFDILNVKHTGNLKPEKFLIVNTSGIRQNILIATQEEHNCSFDVSRIPPGQYIILYQEAKIRRLGSFVKL